MTRYVIDPPAVLELVAGGHAVAAEHRLVAPNSLRSEAMALLLARVRSGDLAEAAALELHERLTEVKIRLLGDRVSRRTAWRIAREHGFDAFGPAEYIAITRLQADALVAADADLIRHAEGLVPLASLHDVIATD